MVDGHDKTDFWMQKKFWFWPFFDLFSDLMDQKLAGAKKVVKIKNLFFHVRQPCKGIFEIHSHRSYNFFPELLMAASIPEVEIFS